MNKENNKNTNEFNMNNHIHNGFDSTKVEYKNINYKKLYIEHTIQGLNSATATNYGVFWIAPCACVITAFYEVHQVAGSDAGAVVLNLEKLISTVAVGSGDEILSTDLSLKTTADIVQNGVITLTSAYRSLKKGDRLALKDTGTLTDVSNVTVLVELIIK